MAARLGQAKVSLPQVESLTQKVSPSYTLPVCFSPELLFYREVFNVSRKLVAAFLIFLVCSMSLVGCGSKDEGQPAQGADSKGDKIVVAIAAPMTGSCAQSGQDIERGVRIAAERINKAGGIDGREIDIVVEDDASDPKQAAAVANKLGNDASVLAVIGHYNSSCTLAGAPIYNRFGIVEMSPGSSAPAVSDAGPYTFRVIPTDALQGEFVAKWMLEEGYDSVAILYENSDYGLGLKDVVQKAFTAAGGQVVGIETYYLGETKDFSSIITKIRATSPEAVFVAGLYNEAALICKQSKAVGWEPAFFGVDALYEESLINLGGPAVENFRINAFFHPMVDDPLVKEFVTEYETLYNAIPGAYAWYGHDALVVIAEAMTNGALDREAIKDYLTTLKDVKGVTGSISFDENGDVIKDPIKLVVKDGKFKLYTK